MKILVVSVNTKASIDPGIGYNIKVPYVRRSNKY